MKKFLTAAIAAVLFLPIAAVGNTEGTSDSYTGYINCSAPLHILIRARSIGNTELGVTDVGWRVFRNYVYRTRAYNVPAVPHGKHLFWYVDNLDKPDSGYILWAKTECVDSAKK